MNTTDAVPASHRVPTELLHAIASQSMGRRCRELCSEIRRLDDASCRSLRFKMDSSPPKATVRRRIAQCIALRRVFLVRLQACVDDELLALLLNDLTQRDTKPEVHLAGCRGLTPISLPALQAYGAWHAPIRPPDDSAKQCTWWLYEPSPSLAPDETVALQLQALRHASATSAYPAAPMREAAIHYCFAFWSHAWVDNGLPAFARVVEGIYTPLLHSSAFAVRARPDDPAHPTAAPFPPALELPPSHDADRRVFEVEVTVPPGRRVAASVDRHFELADAARAQYRCLWFCSRRADGPHAGCWMTDQVAWC